MTLDEAFSKAPEPKINLSFNVRAVDGKPATSMMLGRVFFETYGDRMIIEDAALLAHCFSHMREMRDSATRLAEKVKRANAIQHSGGEIQAEDWSELYSLEQECSAILTKANTITLPE